MNKMKLKQCPFCGLTEQDTVAPDFWTAPAIAVEKIGEMYRVECEGCGVKGPRAFSKKEAENMWNVRK